MKAIVARDGNLNKLNVGKKTQKLTFRNKSSACIARFSLNK